jgi:hypothetical protein
MKIALVILLVIALIAVAVVITIAVTGGSNSETTPTSTPTATHTQTPTPTHTPTQNSTPTPTPTPTYEPGVIYVTAEKLCLDYNTNAIAADAMYKGNILEVSWVVEGIGRDILNNNKAYLRMDCG